MTRVSVVIPSYRRGAIVADTVAALQSLVPAADEILVIDQTARHDEATEARLAALAKAGAFVWHRIARPSIPHAMNHGLRLASGEIVLFLDDDIVPDPGLVGAHREAQSASDLVAGMVLQPGERPASLAEGAPFRFTSDRPAKIVEFMGGNFSIRRSTALALGGFDENFVGAAYRFEAEFAYRYVARHGPIQYTPRAVIHHLQAASGGTRAHGHHLRTVRPDHSVGAYYCLLRTRTPRWWLQFLWRPIRAVRTRHHLRRPWWIPLTLLAELRGMLAAWRLHRRGPLLLDASGSEAP